MKKILLICGAAFFFNLVQAQSPVLNGANNPKIGDTKVDYVADSVGINPGAAGANVVWDFTNIKRVSTKDSIVTPYLSPSQTPYASDYPAANMAGRSVSGNSYSYYNMDANKQEIVGMVSEVQGYTLKHKYTDKYTLMTFPVAFNYNFSDKFVAYYNIDEFVVTRYGDANVKADAYGTLKLGNKTYNNVLRLYNKIYEADTVDYGFTKTAMVIESESWSYMTPGRAASILAILHTTTRNGSSVKSSKLVYFNTEDKITGIKDTEGKIISAEVYPNPANSSCNIRIMAKTASIANISVISQTGQEIQKESQVKLSPENINISTINISTLSPGLYFIKIQTEDGILLEKLVVK